MAWNTSLSSNLSFTLPPIIGYPDCEYTAEWLGASNTAMEFIARMMSNVSNTTYSDSPSSLQWTEWYYSNESVDVLDSFVDYTIQNCTKQFCNELKWEGNSDLAGRGMMITYWLEGTLACIYSIAIYADPYIQALDFKKQTILSKFLPRLSSAIVVSSAELLSTMLLFCLAMLVAAIHGYAASLRFPVGVLIEAERISLIFMTIFTIFPPILVESVIRGVRGSLRRPKLRIALWVSISLLAVAARVLAYYASTVVLNDQIYDHEGRHRYTYEAYCAAETKHLWRALKGFEVTVATLFAFWLIINVPWVQRFKAVGTCNSFWWKVPAAFSFGGIWMFLGIFTAYGRRQAIMSGISNKELSWGLGQVLALTTWVQPVVDMIYTFCFGPEVGQEGQMLKEFSVVRVAAYTEVTESSKYPVGTGSKTDYPLKSLLPADPKLKNPRVGRDDGR